MQHHNSVFHELLKHIPWHRFDALVDEHGADYRVRRLRTRDQFVALLYGQLGGSASLRDIEQALASHRGRLYHLGARRPARSTLADANAKRPWAVFSELFATMAGQASRRVRRRLADQVRLIDATKVKLTGLSADWARFSDCFTAAKIHVVYDPRLACPLSAVITPENVNDITPAKGLEITPGATYVFDLAYYDYGWWAKLDAAGCRFVTRLKVNTPLTITAELPAPEDTNILSERIGHLPKRLRSCGRNPYRDPVREITVRISTGKVIRLVTNDLDGPAEEIADLYKQRWQIELFFKWIKQNLKIKRFLGTSENAVRIQIYVALIAYLLLHLARQAQKAIPSPSAFAKLVRVNLMHRRKITQLLGPPEPPPLPLNQFLLNLGET